MAHRTVISGWPHERVTYIPAAGAPTVCPGCWGTILRGATQGGDTGSCCLNNILIGSYFRRVVCEEGCRLGTGRVEGADLTRAVKPVRDMGAAAEHAP